MLSNKYVLILILFLVWMVFFDTNSFLFHKELNDDIESMEKNNDSRKKDIENDKILLKKLRDSNELEKYAREKYYLKKDNEDIYIIEHEDSLKNKSKDE